MKRGTMSAIGTLLAGSMLVSLLLPVMGGCDLGALMGGTQNNGDNGGSVEPLTVYTESTVSETPEERKYRPVDSFELMDGNYYYIYYLGIIDWVPLSSAGASGFYYDGKVKSKHTFSFSQFSSDETVENLRSVVETGVSLTTKTYIKDSVGATAGIFEAKVEAGIENSMTTSVKETLEHSVMNASLFQTTVGETHDYDLTPGVNAAGYYLYTTVASMKVYESVVYDPAAGSILYMDSFGVLGQGMSGLVYSKTSFFEPDSFSLAFEEEKLGAFEKPGKKLESQTVALDAGGGMCETASVEVAVGQPYPALPVPTRNAYIFDGWYAGDRRIGEGTEAVSLQTITAKWKFVTHCAWTINGYFVVQNNFGPSDSDLDKNMDLPSYFDLIELEKQNYKMRITIEYDCKCATLPVSTQEYKIDFSVNKRNIYTYNGHIGAFQQNFDHIKQYSSLIEPSSALGTMNILITTKNILGIGFQNFKIVVDFVTS